MQITRRDTHPSPPAASGPGYRERLSPSLWALVAAGLVGPMAGLVAAPVGATVALVVGAAAGLGVIGLVVAASPVLEVRDGQLRAGRARIAVSWLGETAVSTGEEARLARGSGLHARSWHLIRGGIDGVLTVEITDPDDPTPEWVISTRTPDRLEAAIRREQVRRSTPRR